MGKPILCLDFDGVIHSYNSGWKGAAVIPDPPVPGALQFIAEALETFEVHIFSSRSHQWGGRRAMKRWLRAQYIALDDDPAPAWWRDRVCEDSSMEPWYIEVRRAADEIVAAIRWPLFKLVAAWSFRSSPWIEWMGGERPVSVEERVEVVFRDGRVMPAIQAGSWAWNHTSDDDDIVAYRVVEAAKGK